MFQVITVVKQFFRGFVKKMVFRCGVGLMSLWIMLSVRVRFLCDRHF